MSYTTKDGESITWDVDDPASLEAWFGNFGHSEHFRKVVLATAAEVERANAITANEKVTEAQLANRARMNDVYVQYLIDTLNARTLRNRNVIEAFN